MTSYSLFVVETVSNQALIDSQALPDSENSPENSSFGHGINDVTMQPSSCSRVLLPFPGLQIALVPH